MGCGTSFVKYCLFFFNLLFALGGLAVLGIGVAILTNLSDVTDAVPSNYKVAPWFFVIIGAIVFIIAFFGCCGAVREGHCMLVSYSVFLLVISIAQIVLAVLVLVYVDDTEKVVKSVLWKTFDKAQGNGQGGDQKLSRELLSSIETKFHCCGVTGAANYGNGVLPSSCCADNNGILQQFTGACTIVETTSRQGCGDALAEFLHKYGKIIAWIAIAVAAVEILGAVFALCLANSIRNMERRYA